MFLLKMPAATGMVNDKVVEKTVREGRRIQSIFLYLSSWGTGLIYEPNTYNLKNLKAVK